MKKSINKYMQEQAKREEQFFISYNEMVNLIQEEIDNTLFFMISKKNKLKKELEFYLECEEKHFNNYIEIFKELDKKI